MVLGGIQESMTELELGLEDLHNHAEILLLAHVEEVAFAIFSIMIIKILKTVGKVSTEKMELLDILIPTRVGTILLGVVELMKLVLILRKAGVDRDHHASLCIITILMGTVKFLGMN